MSCPTSSESPDPSPVWVGSGHETISLRNCDRVQNNNRGGGRRPGFEATVDVDATRRQLERTRTVPSARREEGIELHLSGNERR